MGFNDYFIDGIYDVLNSILPSTILYLIIIFIILLMNKFNFKKMDKLRLFFGYLLVVYIISLFKITGITFSSINIGNIERIISVKIGLPFYDSSFKMIMLNIILFIPFGILISILQSKRINLKKSILIGFGMSLFIEFIQIFTGRLPEIDDLLANTIGTIYGYLIYAIFKNRKINKKTFLNIILLLISFMIITIILFFVAQGDQKQEALYSKFTEVYSEEKIKNLDKIILYSNSKKVIIDDYNGDTDTIYAWIGSSISNSISRYKKQENEIKQIDFNDKIYVELDYKKPQLFTFYNNQDLKLENVKSIIYNVNNGTFYISLVDEKIEEYFYNDTKYPFQIDEDLIDIIKEYYK